MKTNKNTILLNISSVISDPRSSQNLKEELFKLKEQVESTKEHGMMFLYEQQLVELIFKHQFRRHDYYV